MIVVKRECNDFKSVTDYFHHIYKALGRKLFMKLFPVILADNGPEFSNPSAIEFDEDSERRTYVFYCHPGSPQEKRLCEVKHQFIRRIIPKGEAMNPYIQKDINLMMSHIDSYARENLKKFTNSNFLSLCSFLIRILLISNKLYNKKDQN